MSGPSCAASATADLAALAAAVGTGDEGLVLRPSASAGAPLRLPTPASSIARFLYAHYYAGDPALVAADAPDHFRLFGLRVSDPAFLDALRHANPGTGYLQPGWTVLGPATGREWLVRREGLTLTVDADRHLGAEPVYPSVGDVVAVRFPKDSALGSPGFYVAFSDAGPARGAGSTRVYLDVRAECAIEVTAELLRRLLPHSLPYTYKIVSDPERYGRRDAAVLYVGRHDLSRVLPQVLALHAEQPSAFVDAVPAFTRAVRPGIALADNPAGAAGDNLSFGEHRCALVAAAIARTALDAMGVDQASLLAEMRQELWNAGLDPDRPYLASRGADDYDAEIKAGAGPPSDR